MEAGEHGYFAQQPVVEGVTDEIVDYHVHLMSQAGLITAIDTTALDSASPGAIPLGITWAGHDFLDAAKDDTLWNKAKATVIKPAAGVAFDVLLAWLKHEAKQRLGLP